MTKNKHKNKPWILQEFGISLSTEPTLQQLKKAVFLLNSWKQRFLLKICLAPFPLYPHTKKNHPNSKSNFAPPPSQKVLVEPLELVNGTLPSLNGESLEITLTSPLNCTFYFEKNTLQYTVWNVQNHLGNCKYISFCTSGRTIFKNTQIFSIALTDTFRNLRKEN